jgi:Na+/H+-dicarboxylate symporter
MKKIKMPKLHNQILIALILGSIFGSLFNVDSHLLEIKIKHDKKIQTITVKDWETAHIISGSDTLAYSRISQLEIINNSKKIISTNEKFSMVFYDCFYGEAQTKSDKKVISGNIISVAKEGTAATSIKWIGDIFIRLLNMIAVPLVLASLIVGAASLGDIKRFARIGTKTLAFYISTTIIAISIGLTLANLVKPGLMMNSITKERLLSVYSGDIVNTIDKDLGFNFSEFIVNIVPKNPFGAIAGSDMLQIVFFAVMFGMVLTMIQKEKAEPVINFFDGLSEVMIRAVDVVMIIAPLGVFALISSVIAQFGFDILQTLIGYSITVLVGLLIQGTIVYGGIVKFFTKIKLIDFFKALRRTQAIGFTTSSSAATLPVNMEVCQDSLGVSKRITSFVLPLGATINMDGTALYQGVASVFIAQVFGMDLNLGQQLTIVFTAVLASIGTAPVPGVGIIMLVIILKSVGIPEEGIALIIGVDRILDMCRTVINVTGDAAVTVAVASSENEIENVTI